MNLFAESIDNCVKKPNRSIKSNILHNKRINSEKTEKEIEIPTNNNNDNNDNNDNNNPSTKILSFKDLGLCDWICKSTKAVGFKKPTDIQSACIPSILNGQNVMGCAQTGSGKTAAFALPILQKLSEDPYGIFCIILIPTRELAIQMNEQISALGASIGIRVSLIIGGMSIIEQGIELAKKPHFICATPGRLRHHLESAEPPYLKNTKFLVLDEADRLLSTGFASELESILSHMSPTRQTLIFSATLTDSLEELEKYSTKKTLRYDLTRKKGSLIPEKLVQQYVLMPPQVKVCYLVTILAKIVFDCAEKLDKSNNDNDNNKNSSSSSSSKRKNRDESLTSQLKNKMDSLSTSVIIFVGTCKRCQETQLTLTQLGFNCVALHSMMNQSKRISSLERFKNESSRILLATDVASRGLDIPTVELVINFDLPKVAADYVHRIGRTARAGRSGRSLAFITPHEVELVHKIESYAQIRMEKSEEVDAEDITPWLNPVSKAIREVELKLMEDNFDEKVDKFKQRKKKKSSLSSKK